MGQEFHVLRCFSCQVFQVQQVKKSRRWVCKVCGEKQSLLKEFGRGGAADCRRHVQKLNALRGRLQEVRGDTPGSQPEQDDEGEDDEGDEGLDGDAMDNPEEAAHPVSRWSKYTDPTDEEEEEEEEQNIYTETQRFHGSRKRRKISDEQSYAGTPDVCEDEPYLPVHQDRMGSAWNKGSASSNLPSSGQAVRSYPTASRSTHTAENPGNKPPHASLGESSDSRWDRFLAVVPSQRDEEEYDHQASSQYNNTGMPYFTEALADTGVDCEEQTSGGVGVDGGLSTATDTHASNPLGSADTVSDPAPLARIPCSKLSFNPMFLTEEDFDDTF